MIGVLYCVPLVLPGTRATRDPLSYRKDDYPDQQRLISLSPTAGLICYSGGLNQARNIKVLGYNHLAVLGPNPRPDLTSNLRFGVLPWTPYPTSGIDKSRVFSETRSQSNT